MEYIRNWDPVSAVAITVQVLANTSKRPDWLKELMADGKVKLYRNRFVVESEYGTVAGNTGDYLILSPGGLYVMRKNAFEDHYDQARGRGK